MIKPILQSGDPVLRTKSKDIEKIDKKILDLIKDMKDTLVVQKDPEGIGLAAPQIGKNFRIFLMKPKKTEEAQVIINPKIVSIKENQESGIKNQAKKRKSDIMEGCLSLPHFYGPLTRAQKLTLEFMDENWKKQTKTFENLMAQIVLHEIDHLDGVLFIDRLLEQKKPLYEFKGGEWEEIELI
jgi:peptide deformylase